jgi:hypothetical protein
MQIAAAYADRLDLQQDLVIIEVHGLLPREISL